MNGENGQRRSPVIAAEAGFGGIVGAFAGLGVAEMVILPKWYSEEHDQYYGVQEDVEDARQLLQAKQAALENARDLGGKVDYSRLEADVQTHERQLETLEATRETLPYNNLEWEVNGASISLGILVGALASVSYFKLRRRRG